MNVLIVDDHQAAADLLAELLQMQDDTVRVAYSVRQGLELWAAESFNAALIDLTLPDAPGTELARRLRAEAAGKPLLLIAMSGLSARDAIGADAPGLFDHYLEKPIDFDAFDRIVADARTRLSAAP